MILVYTNKHFVTKSIAPYILQKYPNQEIIYIHSMYFINVSFDYPKNIKWKDFPYLAKPLFKIGDTKDWKVTTLINGKLEYIDITFEKIINCEKIIYAADPCSTDTYLFNQFISKLFNKNSNEMNIDCIFLNSFAKEDIKNSVDNMCDFTQTFQQKMNEGKVKKYFDYNYNFNSFALLGKVYRKINNDFGDEENIENDFGNIFISKNMLQILYFIDRQQQNELNYKEGQLLSEMNHWKGTGKYKSLICIGNSCSSFPIIENLMLLKLIESKDKRIFITPKGQQFLECLPKDSIDYDLPFRIELWGKLPFEESKLKIDVYLHNCFKKIKNKLKGFDKLYTKRINMKNEQLSEYKP